MYGPSRGRCNNNLSFNDKLLEMQGSAYFVTDEPQREVYNVPRGTRVFPKPSRYFLEPDTHTILIIVALVAIVGAFLLFRNGAPKVSLSVLPGAAPIPAPVPETASVAAALNNMVASASSNAGTVSNMFTSA